MYTQNHAQGLCNKHHNALQGYNGCMYATTKRAIILSDLAFNGNKHNKGYKTWLRIASSRFKQCGDQDKALISAIIRDNFVYFFSKLAGSHWTLTKDQTNEYIHKTHFCVKLTRITVNSLPASVVC